jgi:hypothetical protein
MHDIEQLKKVQDRFVNLMNVLPPVNSCNNVFVDFDQEGAVFILEQIVQIWSVTCGDDAFKLNSDERAVLWFMFVSCRHFDPQDEKGVCAKCVHDFCVLMLRLLATIEHRELQPKLH